MRRPARPWGLLALLLLLLAVVGPQLPRFTAGSSTRAPSPIAYGALGADDAVVAALARPTGVAAARGDERPHLALVAAAPVADVSVPAPVALGSAPEVSYDVRAGVPVEPTSRGPPPQS